MSNPVINRLGKNQFWYTHFNPSGRYSSKTQLNYLLPAFINKYLNYGVSPDKLPRSSFNWHLKTPPTNLRRAFFKRVFYTNSTLGIEHSYQIRLTTSQYFPMKTWIMDYNGWLVVQTAWFKPMVSKAIKSLQPSNESAYHVNVRKRPEKKVHYEALIKSSSNYIVNRLTSNYNF